MKDIIKQLEYFGNATIKATKNDYKSVDYVNENCFEQACELLEENKKPLYVGVKNTELLMPFIEQMRKSSGIQYLIHTKDAMAENGRAIDTLRINPLTARAMTGSSSGTAINVLLGINDIGIGTDGGGSVLAPALSTNLYSFMSPLLPIESQRKHSTDALSFTPSAGIFTRSLALLRETTENILHFKLKKNLIEKMKIAVINEATSLSVSSKIKNYTHVEGDIYASRQELIPWLQEQFNNFDILISKEGPIDIEAYGDTLQGCFSLDDTKRQMTSNKGLIRVVNMAGFSAITVPASELATGFVVICESNAKAIARAFDVAQELKVEYPAIIKKYFHKNF